MKSNFEIAKSSPLTLTLTLNNSQPIELTSFLSAFSSIAQEYQNSISGNPNFESNPEIFVREIRSGSMIADLVPVIVSTAPIIANNAEQLWVTLKFVEKWKARISDLANGIVPTGISKSELASFAGAVEAIARDPNASSQLEVATFIDKKRQVEASFQFGHREAVAVKEVIEGEFERLDKRDDATLERVLMYFTRSDVGSAPKDKRSGEKVIVPQIGEKALPIIYASTLAEEKIKHEIRDGEDNIYKKGFNVDVSVLYRGARPIVYRILAVYEVIDLIDD